MTEWNDEITTLEHRSCAESAADCLSDSGTADWDRAFHALIDSAAALGLMPDDQKVIRETLAKFGFAMQSAALENITVEEALGLLKKPPLPDTVFIQIAVPLHRGGYMLAFRADGADRMEPVSEPPEPGMDILRAGSVHVWLRWDDGIDRSPYPRKTSASRREAAERREDQPETFWFKSFQPNPKLNNIGDCVIRGLAGALNVSWEESLRLLAAENHTTVNAREVYPVVLAKLGFVRHEPIIWQGRRMDGTVFCAEMNHRYQNGERIFAHAGQHHVCAVIPTKCADGATRYKLNDSWDSTSRPIGEYWVLPAELLPERKNRPAERPAELTVGSIIVHKMYGKGVITAENGSILSIDFGEKGIRRLEKTWVGQNCTAGS